MPKMLLTLGLLLVLGLYSIAWSGTLHFDDNPNLDGLHGVSDFSSGIQFVFSGRSGPTGRPLSLAAFALQHESWPDPEAFLVFNTLVHVINGLLCFFLLRRLLGWILTDGRSAEWLAVISALVWAASPVLASSSLMVVQRMTGLSAFFVLLSLVFYTNFRSRYQKRSFRANFLLASIVGAGTLLAGCSKENGFLLPVFVMLIECLLVPNARITIKPLHKGFAWLVLLAPLAVILGFLLYRSLSPDGYLYRDFTFAERILTQPRVLFDYIHSLLLPASDSITPFFDNYGQSTGLLEPTTTLFSLLALPALLVIGWLVRRRQPLVSFGLLWFFAGHLLESTLLPLELYFPHRNYIPAVGLYLAIAVLFREFFKKVKVSATILPATASAIFILECAVLLNGTALWGNRELAAEIWFKENPDSVRASQYLYRTYVLDGQSGSADIFIESLIKEHPGQAIFSVQALAICGNSERHYSAKISRAIEDIQSATRIMPSLGSLIQQVAAYSMETKCSFLTPPDAERLAEAGLRNSGLIHPAAKQGLLFAKAQIAEDRRNYNLAIELIKESLGVRPTLQTAELITYFYVQNNDFAGAEKFIKKAIEDPPVGIRQGLVWRSRLREILKLLNAREAASDSNQKVQ